MLFRLSPLPSCGTRPQATSSRNESHEPLQYDAPAPIITRPPTKAPAETPAEILVPHSAIGHLTPVEYANQVRAETSCLGEIS